MISKKVKRIVAITVFIVYCILAVYQIYGFVASKNVREYQKTAQEVCGLITESNIKFLPMVEMISMSVNMDIGVDQESLIVTVKNTFSKEIFSCKENKEKTDVLYQKLIAEYSLKSKFFETNDKLNELYNTYDALYEFIIERNSYKQFDLDYKKLNDEYKDNLTAFKKDIYQKKSFDFILFFPIIILICYRIFKFTERKIANKKQGV